MIAADILMSEHRVIECMITALETGAGVHEKYLALAEKYLSDNPTTKFDQLLNV